MFKVLPPLSSTLGRSERESMEMAESVRTAVTPRVTRSEVASLFSQNPTQDSTTISAQGRYTWTVMLHLDILTSMFSVGHLNEKVPGVSLKEEDHL